MLGSGHGCFTEDHPGGIVRLPDVGMTQKLLQDDDIQPIFQQVGCICMAQRVQVHLLGDGGFLKGRKVRKVIVRQGMIVEPVFMALFRQWSASCVAIYGSILKKK